MRVLPTCSPSFLHVVLPLCSTSHIHIALHIVLHIFPHIALASFPSVSHKSSSKRLRLRFFPKQGYTIMHIYINIYIYIYKYTCVSFLYVR